jgi:hypothetical protein
MPGKRKMETQQLLNGMIFSDSSIAK